MEEVIKIVNEIGVIKPNTKNWYYGVTDGRGRNNAWVYEIYFDNDVLTIKFQVLGDDGWHYITDKAENFFNSNGYQNEVNGISFYYAPKDILRCIEHCREYYNWYIEKDKPYIVSFG